MTRPCAELLDRLLIVKEQHLSQVPIEYLRNCNTARPHRALSQLTPTPVHPNRSTSPSTGSAGKQVPGGLTHAYYVAA